MYLSLACNVEDVVNGKPYETWRGPWQLIPWTL